MKEEKISIETIADVFCVLRQMTLKKLVNNPQKDVILENGKIRYIVDLLYIDNCPFPIDIDVTIRKHEIGV